MKQDPVIMTHSGRYVSLLAPSPEDIVIEDIAYALARINRYTGHADPAYSVGQHSLFVAKLVPEEFRLDALLHDATEAYLGDVATPLKALMPTYRVLEERFWKVIAGKFKLHNPPPACVKQADLVALATERRDLLPDIDHPAWALLDGVKASPVRIAPCTSAGDIGYQFWAMFYRWQRP